MEKKKTKLTISGNPKKSIDNIELARFQNKNSVIIEKRTNRFVNNNPVRKAALPQMKVFLIKNQKYLKKINKRQMIMKNVNLLNKGPLKDLKVTQHIKIQKVKHLQKKGN